MMKKLLVVLLAVGVMFCFAATAMADTTQNTAQERLNELAIMQGDPNGNFRPQDSLTRAEFAKIAVIASGYKKDAEAWAATKTAFSDVKTNAWYTGYINVAYEKGLIAGYEDKTFRPSQAVTNREAVTMVLRVLGYQNLSGTWPENYLNLAREQGLFDNAAAVKAKALRGEIAVLVNTALDKTVVAFNSTTKTYEAQKTASGSNLTLLAQLNTTQTKPAGVYYGIVLDYTLSEKAVNSITLFTEAGKTVTYPVAAGVYADMSAEAAIKAGTAYVGYRAVEKGAFIKYGVDANGKISKDYTTNYTTDSDGKGDTSPSSKTVSFNGKRYALTEDASIFNLTVKNNALSVELLSLKQVLAANIVYGQGFKLRNAVYDVPSMAAMLPDASAARVLDNLVLADYGVSRGTSYGFVEEAGFKDAEGDDSVAFYGDAVSYKVAAGSSAGIAKGKLYDCYKSGDGGLKLLELAIGDFVALNGSATKQVCEVVQESSGLLNVQKIGAAATTAQYEITEDTVFYEYDWSSPDKDPAYTDGVSVGDRIYLLTNTKNEVLLIIIDHNL